MDKELLYIILKKINIPYYKNVHTKYIFTENMMNFKQRYHSQYKEGITNKYIYKFENINFIIYHHIYNNNHDISISKLENEEFSIISNNQDNNDIVYDDKIIYLHIQINKENTEDSNMAYVKFISFTKKKIIIDLICKDILKCMIEYELFIRLIIYFLKEKQNELDINKIILYDNSYYSNKDIELPILHTLVYNPNFYIKVYT